MNEISDTELKRNVSDKGTWTRFIFMVMFGIVFYFAGSLAFLIALFQFLAKLFGGRPFDGLSEFGGNLAAYLEEVTSYMTFASDEKPFPFTAFPDKKKSITTL